MADDLVNTGDLPQRDPGAGEEGGIRLASTYLMLLRASGARELEIL